MTLEKILYTAKAHTTGGRDGGASHTNDGRLDVKLSSPGRPGVPVLPRHTRQHRRHDQCRLIETSRGLITSEAAR